MRVTEITVVQKAVVCQARLKLNVLDNIAPNRPFHFFFLVILFIYFYLDPITQHIVHH